MRIDRLQLDPQTSSFVLISKSKRGFPFLPGLCLIALGVTVLLFPRLFLTAIAVCLVGLGALFCYLAYKFIMLRKQLGSLAKSMESSLYGSSFRSRKADTEFTEIDKDTIVYH